MHDRIKNSLLHFPLLLLDPSLPARQCAAPSHTPMACGII